MTAWSFGELPRVVGFDQNGVALKGFPALVDELSSVGIRVFADAERAAEAHRAGLRRLLMLNLPGQFKSLRKRLPGIREMCLDYAPLPPCPFPVRSRTPVAPCDELTNDLLLAIAGRAGFGGDGDVRTAEAFDACRAKGQVALFEVSEQLCALVRGVLGEHRRLMMIVAGRTSEARRAVSDDIRAQLSHLVYRGFVARTPSRWLNELPRYLKGIMRRLERLENNPGGDAQKADQIGPLWQAYKEQLERFIKGGGDHHPDLEAFRWGLEEFRISLFAQELGTRFPVSVGRLEKQWRAIRAADGH